jgi:hypothetical protein
VTTITTFEHSQTIDEVTFATNPTVGEFQSHGWHRNRLKDTATSGRIENCTTVTAADEIVPSDLGLGGVTGAAADGFEHSSIHLKLWKNGRYIKMFQYELSSAFG